MGPLADRVPAEIGFLEVAPENWVGVGGRLRHFFDRIAQQVPIVGHGLSLNIGGPAALDEDLVLQIKSLLDRCHSPIYGDHLSYCADDGHLYDLLPIPFSKEAVEHVAQRIRRVQALLERRIAIENVSYYCSFTQELSEIEFINAVMERADCLMLLDINNIYVNSVNHGYDPVEFLKAMPGERIAYAHIAGHYREADDLIIDTHGADVIDPVWDLLDQAYAHFGVFPTLLERDFNVPTLDEALVEIRHIAEIQQRHVHMSAANSSAPRRAVA